MGYFFVTCNVSMKLEREFHFPNSTGYVTNHLHYVLLITSFLSLQLFSYCILCVSSCQCHFPLKYNIYSYCNSWPNQHRCHGPFLDHFGIQWICLYACHLINTLRYSIWLIPCCQLSLSQCEVMSFLGKTSVLSTDMYSFPDCHSE